MRKVSVRVSVLRAIWRRIMSNTACYRSANLSTKMASFERHVAFTPALRPRCCLLLLTEY